MGDFHHGTKKLTDRLTTIITVSGNIGEIKHVKIPRVIVSWLGGS